MIPNLAKSDLEAPRHPKELFEWVHGISEEFGKTPEGKNAMRLRESPLLKKFCEEIWPLANYAKLFFEHRSDVSFVPVVGNQNYDALLKDDNSGATLCYFEITQALYGDAGYQDRLRMEHLAREGHVQLTGRPLKRDPGTKCVVKQEPEADIDVDYVARTKCQLHKAIKAKANKQYCNNTVLIIEFDTSLLQYRKGYKDAIDTEAKCELCNLARPFFSELALIPDSGEFGLRYENRGPPMTVPVKGL